MNGKKYVVWVMVPLACREKLAMDCNGREEGEVPGERGSLGKQPVTTPGWGPGTLVDQFDQDRIRYFVSKGVKKMERRSEVQSGTTWGSYLASSHADTQWKSLLLVISIFFSFLFSLLPLFPLFFNPLHLQYFQQYSWGQPPKFTTLQSFFSRACESESLLNPRVSREKCGQFFGPTLSICKWRNRGLERRSDCPERRRSHS